MALLLYLVTAVVCLALTHRLVRRLSRWAALVLVVLPMGITGPALVTGSVYGPVDHIYQYAPWAAKAQALGIEGARNASATDVWSEFFPWREVVRQSLARGEWPLWNPYNLAGHPLAAEAQAAPFSPFTLIACVLPAAVSLTFTASMALFLAGLSAFVLARELGCEEGAALIAAAGWGLASCVVLYSLTAMGFATVYAPLLCAATLRVVREPGTGSGLLLTIALSLCLLAGHPESAFLNALVASAYAVFELVRNRAHAPRAIAIAAAAGLVAFLLCAIALLPLLEAIPQSNEYLLKSEAFAKLPRGVALRVSLASLATDVFPFLHVRQWQSPKLGYIGAETAAVGSLILGLAVYALWRRRSAETWFFGALALFCILAGARWAPLAETLHKLPLLSITFHDRLAFHGALALMVLASLGADYLLRHNDQRAAAMTFAAVLVVLGAGTWWLHRAHVIAVTPSDYGRYRVLAELVFLGAAVALLAMKPRALPAALLALVVGQRTLSEIDTFGTFPADAMHPRVALLEPLGHIREPFRIVGRGMAMPPAMNVFYGLEDARGYDALTLAQYVRTWKLWCRRHGIWFNRVDDLTAPMLSLMNVRFAVQSDGLDVPAGWKVVGRESGAMLLENAAYLERIFVPERATVTRASVEEIVDRMGEVRDFRAMAWITARDEAGERRNGPGRITLRGRRLGGEYRFEADMQGDGYVVISDCAWKGWQAWVDGQRVPLSRANAMFLAVRVPAGKHDVRLLYRPVSFVRGRATTFATLIVLIGAAIVGRAARPLYGNGTSLTAKA